MPAISNMEWSGRGTSRSTDGGWQSSLSWFVYGAANEDLALAATPDPNGGGPSIPSLTGTHPYSSSLRVKSIKVDAEGGPNNWKVTVQFATPSFGNPNPTDPEPNPLLRKPRFAVQNGEVTIPVDRDADQKKIVNSVGDVYTPERTRTVRIKTVLVKYFAPYYDWSLVNTYEDTINNSAFTIGTLNVSAGNARIMGIDLLGEYPLVVPYVEMQIAIAVAIQRGVDADKFPFWYTYLKDQGTHAYGTGNKYGSLVTAAGDPVTDPVALDGAGKPIDTSLKVRIETGLVDAIASPSTVRPGVPVLTPSGSNTIRVHKFRDYPSTEFASLFSTIGQPIV